MIFCEKKIYLLYELIKNIEDNKFHKKLLINILRNRNILLHQMNLRAFLNFAHDLLVESSSIKKKKRILSKWRNFARPKIFQRTRMYLTICCLNLFLHNNKKYFFDCIQKWSTKKYNEPNSPWTRSRKN